MKEMVASNMILSATVPKFWSPNKSKGQSSFGLTSATLNLLISESWSKRSWRNMLYRSAEENVYCPLYQCHRHTFDLSRRSYVYMLCPFNALESTR